MDHIFTLQTTIEETRHYSSKAFYYFVDFRKHFDSIPREAMLQKLKDIGISKIHITTVMHLYEVVLGHLHTTHGLSNFTHLIWVVHRRARVILA